MTKEELEKEAEKYADGIYHYKINVSDYGEDGKINYRYSDVKEAYQKGAEPREKRIEELEEDNDARKFAMAMSEKVEEQWQKEKCELIGTIQARDKTIQELEKEIEKIKKTYRKQRNKRIDELQKANAILLLEKATVKSDLLNKAKDLIKWFVWYFREGSPNLVPYKHKVEEAEQFLNIEVEK